MRFNINTRNHIIFVKVILSGLYEIPEKSQADTLKYIYRREGLKLEGR